MTARQYRAGDTFVDRHGLARLCVFLGPLEIPGKDLGKLILLWIPEDKFTGLVTQAYLRKTIRDAGLTFKPNRSTNGDEE